MSDSPSPPADDKLRAAVLARLSRDPQTASSAVRVGVRNGIVHLAGSAPTVEIWEVAAELARGVPGVRGVVNRIEAPGAPEPGRTVQLKISQPPPESTA
jgi:hypothetical protein